MLTLQNLLLPTDQSACASSALRHALWLAERQDATLHVLTSDSSFGLDHVLTLAPVPLAQSVTPSWREAATVPDTVKIVEVEEHALFAGDAIVHYAETMPIDVIVMATHGRTGLQRLLHRSVTETVVREAPCPVLSLRCDVEIPPLDQVERLLVPIDFSEFTPLALRYASALGAMLGVKAIDLLHVIPDPDLPDIWSPPSDQQSAKSIWERASTALDDHEAHLEEQGFTSTGEVRGGYPATQILNALEDAPPTLLVMPTHGLTGLKHFLVGSVTEKVVRMAPCPVFVVKSFGRSLVG